MNRFSLTTIVLLSLFLTGCGDGKPRPVPVSGTIQFQGQPLAQGDVIFVPATRDAGQMARGTISADGSYELSTPNLGHGALPGDYKVTVFSHDGMREIPGMVAPAVGPSLIPIRFNDASTTDLEATVGEEGGEINLDLTD